MWHLTEHNKAIHGVQIYTLHHKLLHSLLHIAVPYALFTFV